MIFKSLSNKFLTVNSNVVLTEHIDPVIFLLDKEFEAAGVKARVTSGKRDPESQLRIIRTAIINHQLGDEYPEVFEPMNEKFIWNGQQVYKWQPSWSKLLNIGLPFLRGFNANAFMNVQAISFLPSGR